ncbi:MAG: hypothetical protein J5680_02840 [Neisseriaceae bacterium]|nr:hypothetical protein [Neisseriaceae bacterium]
MIKENFFRQPETLKATPIGVVGGLKTHPTAFLYLFSGSLKRFTTYFSLPLMSGLGHLLSVV